jgi:hypothetical protein
MSDVTSSGIVDDLGKQGKRDPSHRRSVELEAALHLLNGHLMTAARTRPSTDPLPYRPVFIVGCPRSGSTLVSQVLARSGDYCYPTNIMSRFYGDPWVGALVHRILYDLDNRNEIFRSEPSTTDYLNDIGKTAGPAEPNEFWYWWRRFFKFNSTHADLVPVTEADGRRFRAELGEIMQVFRKPFVGKAMIMNWKLPLLAQIVPEALFLFIERDLEQNALSLLRTRERFYGDRSEWYAFKPEEYDRIVQMDPIEQVFAQVHFTAGAVETGLASLPPERSLHWRYEEFCSDPSGHLSALSKATGSGAPSVQMAPFDVRNGTWPDDVTPNYISELAKKYAAGAHPLT